MTWELLLVNTKLKIKMSLQVVSYNCNSAKNNIDTIRDLIRDHDIICLQETFLCNSDTNFLEGLAENINFCISDCVFNISEKGRPRGGLVTLWKSYLNDSINPIIFKENFLGIEIKGPDRNLVLINTYLPFENNSIEQLTKYREIIASLSRYIELLQDSSVVVLGDLNADPKPSRFWREIQDFCSQYEFYIADLSLPSDSFTYLSAAHDTFSWLDHVLVSRSDMICHIRILHYLCIVDHFPLSIDIKFEATVDQISREFISPQKFANWLQYSRHKNEIANEMNKCFHAGTWENDLLDCPLTGCDKPSHKHLIRKLYDYLINSLLHWTQILNFERRKNFKAVPGWNNFCKEKHAVARFFFIRWKEEGMFRSGVVYDAMKNSRVEFRNALLFCRKNENSIREAQTISAFDNKDFKTFWKHISVKKIK